jgi:peptidoglycan/LPS O-acetylase OafA/YrhL
MDLRRLRVGEWLAAVSGLALLASLFLPWYGPDSATGWEALSAIDVLLAFVAASGVLLAIVTATQSVPAVPIALAAIVTLVGLAGVVLVLLRALDIPDWAASREWGLWLGLAGTLGIVAGSMLAMRQESLPGAAPAEIEAIPAPRP